MPVYEVASEAGSIKDRKLRTYGACKECYLLGMLPVVKYKLIPGCFFFIELTEIREFSELIVEEIRSINRTT